MADLLFAISSVASNVLNWRVEEEMGTLSDHLYVKFECFHTANVMIKKMSSRFLRWALSRLNKEMAKDADNVSIGCQLYR